MSSGGTPGRVWCTASGTWHEFTSLVVRGGRYALVLLAEGKYGLLKGEDQLLPFRFSNLNDGIEALEVLAGLRSPRRGAGRRRRKRR
jgi:hypothetical protein